MMIDSEARKRRTQGTLSDNDRKGFKAHHKCGHNSGGGPRKPEEIVDRKLGVPRRRWRITAKTWKKKKRREEKKKVSR